MKKIGIVTVQNSMNYGAYLQAYVLSNLCKEETDVYFIKTCARKPYWQTTKDIIKSICKIDFKQVKYRVKLLLKYRQAWKEFKVIPANKITNEDICITGSDEIWNISRKDFLNYPIFFGVGVHTQNIISYAPSCNTTSIEKFKDNPSIINALSKYKAISVRDYHTQEVISKLVEKEVQRVLDPTLLRDKSYYKQKQKDTNIQYKYILVYSYSSDFSQEQVKDIKNFAEKNELKIVSVGLYLEWCDENIPASPMEFLGLLDKAEYVITSTFHGTVFSTIYKKNFITYAGKKQKILNFLQEWELQDRNFSSFGDLNKIAKEQVNYDKVESKIEIARKKSLVYLLSQIKK